MKAILTVGISASGKSTWAKQYAEENGFVVFERDIVRRQIAANSFGLKNDEPLSKVWNWRNQSMEGAVLQQITAKLVHAATMKQNVIIADTNLNATLRDKLVKFLVGLGYSVEYKVFPIDLEEAITRDSGRLDSVGRTVMTYQHKQFEEYRTSFGK